MASHRWQALAAAGGHPQRPLWASTGVKDPTYVDTRYVDELVAPGVVNTMPAATLEAVADHGAVPADSVRGTYDKARATLEALSGLGIDLDAVTADLEDEGVTKFETSWTELLDTVDTALAAARAELAR